MEDKIVIQSMHILTPMHINYSEGNEKKELFVWIDFVNNIAYLENKKELPKDSVIYKNIFSIIEAKKQSIATPNLPMKEINAGLKHL